MRVLVTTGSVFRADNPEPLFEGEASGPTLASIRGNFDSPPCDVHPDGERLVMIESADEAAVVVVENWVHEVDDAQPN